MNKKLGTAVVVMAAFVFGPMTAGAEEAASRIEVSGTGETSTHECTPGTEVEVTGASNTVTLTGECKRLTVEGASNTVTWKRGPGKSKPKVSRTGVGNKVTQQK